ncbi:MAG TPA: flap endonuclease-1 [Methanotrichaceae archaeon]|nr:flap endonuclease-1 [Methanotrichaceae archaeon]
MHFTRSNEHQYAGRSNSSTAPCGWASSLGGLDTGVDLGELLHKKKIGLEDLTGKWVAVDAFNTLYQFLSIIRQRDGTPLMDNSGRVTSHLSGILYRTTNLIEAGIKVAFVFDGVPHPFKAATLQERSEVRDKAQAAWDEAKAEGRDGFKYAQAASRLNQEILADSKRLISAMGLPTIQAPSEGEAQAAYMAARGDVYIVGSQDYDSLLFGAPLVVRNLAITGKRKLPRKNVYVDVEPEVIVLEEELSRMGISRKQLVEIGIMCGTDYNPGLMRVGPKTGLKLIREHGDLESVLASQKESIENFQEIREFFLHPDVTDDYTIKMSKPRIDEIVSFLNGERDFSRERVEKTAQRLEEAFKVGQSTLDRWF